MDNLYLPEAVKNFLNQNTHPHQNTHPGLQLDKYSSPDNQESQKRALERVVELQGNQAELDQFIKRRNSVLATLKAATFRAKTAGPLTLHLSRATALENAGICLHPVYGFTYLPGSGLKGMARAYAETVWQQQQADKSQEEGRINSVLGNKPGEKDKNKQHAGSVVFHEAWPVTWPKLIVDIVNNHHPKYYGGKDDKEAPGDWEDPNPVYFLAVASGCEFDFALSKRSGDASDEDLELARQWLIGALAHLGAGAKTNAGYGSFEITDEQPEVRGSVKETVKVWKGELVPESRSYFEEKVTLELVTPAFLAGANQDGFDCDLRSATLRGLLRWWWRTMHSGYLTVSELRRLESMIWGNTEASGAVRVDVKSLLAIPPLPFERQQTIKDNQLERATAEKTAQGLTYLSYGTDEKNGSRSMALPGTRWEITLSARNGYLENETIQAQTCLQQAMDALWLLCQYGAVGSKAKHGFGSFKEITGADKDSCQENARAFRQACHLSKNKSNVPANSPSLDWIAGDDYIKTPWANHWYALDQLGFAIQAFAKKYRHNLEKKALGLPRKIRGPFSGNFRAPDFINDRHSSPVQFHVVKEKDGMYSFRVIAFIAKHLPSAEQSESFLKEFMSSFKLELTKRAKEFDNKGKKVVAPTLTVRQPVSGAPKAKDIVTATLLAKHTKKGDWGARHEESGLSGPIQNKALVPEDAKHGDQVSLLVKSTSRTSIDFAWPVAGKEEVKQKETKKGKEKKK